MNYTEFKNINNIFEQEIVQSYGYNYQDWEKLSMIEKDKEIDEINSVLLNESIIIGAAAIGIVALGILFRKRIIDSIGSKIAIKKLKQKADNFKVKAMGGLDRAIKQFTNTKDQIKKENGVTKWTELSVEKRNNIVQLEKQISKVFHNYVDKITQIKQDEINKYIDSKKLKETTKSKLKFVWLTLSTEVEVAMLGELMKKGIIEAPNTKKLLDTIIKSKNEYIRNQGDKILNFSSKESVSKDDASNIRKKDISMGILKGGKL